MYQDKLLRFISASKDWEDNLLASDFKHLRLNNFPGDAKDCLLMSRYCNIDEMESEDDEQYIFQTPDGKVKAKFNRFQTRLILTRFGLKFDQERIDAIIKACWNYPTLAVNKLNAQWEPYAASLSGLPPLISGGAPPIKTIYIEE